MKKLLLVILVIIGVMAVLVLGVGIIIGLGQRLAMETIPQRTILEADFETSPPARRCGSAGGGLSGRSRGGAVRPRRRGKPEHRSDSRDPRRRHQLPPKRQVCGRLFRDFR